jgi:hypothetical protein
MVLDRDIASNAVQQKEGRRGAVVPVFPVAEHDPVAEIYSAFRSSSRTRQRSNPIALPPPEADRDGARQPNSRLARAKLSWSAVKLSGTRQPLSSGESESMFGFGVRDSDWIVFAHPVVPTTTLT